MRTPIRSLLPLLGIVSAAGLAAYGVSPSQYAAGRAQDAQLLASPALPAAPTPHPLAPGQTPPQPLVQPLADQDYGTVPIPDWAKGWKHYSFGEARDLWAGKQALFCDARTKMEYDQGHIPGAILLSVGDFDKNFADNEAKIRAAKNIVIYCHGIGCHLSDKVAAKLVKDKNITNVGAFFGGWPQWQQHNMPEEAHGRTFTQY
jgi:rhodanese-related sulfurtransferase